MPLFERAGMKVNPWVFFPSAVLILVFVALGATIPAAMEAAFQAIQAFIVEKLGWFYIVSVAFFLGFVGWLFFSRYGSIKLGKDDDEPDYNRVTWFAMLFSAGVGIGAPVLQRRRTDHSFRSAT